MGTAPVKIQTRLKGAAAPIALAVVLAAHPAVAQDDTTSQTAAEAATDADDDNVILVTGSRIVRPELEGAAPLIAAVGEQELEERAFTNISDALNEVPGFGTPIAPTGDQSSFSVGQNFVNLFGIGSQRTLTLVNGRRFVSSNTASNFGGAAAGLQVDLNVLPVSLVDRIDVLAVKGATTYGSDAIAGTVNVILKDDFEGFEAVGQVGIYGQGYGESVYSSATLGGNFDDGRGNIAINFEYDRQDGVRTLDTKLGREGLFRDSENTIIQPRTIFLLTAGGLPTRGAGLFDGGYITGAITGSPGAFFDADGNFVQFDNNGNLVPYDVGDPVGLVSANGGDGLFLSRASQILSDVERYSIFSLGHYELTDNVRMFYEANYAHTQAVELVNQPVYQSALFADDSLGYGVLLSNPFLSDQARGILSRPGNLDGDGDGVADLNFDTDGDGVNDDTQFFLQRAGFDLLGGDNPNRQQLELFRIVGGLQGDLEMLGRDFFWNASYSFGRSQAVSRFTSLVQANFLTATDAVAVDQAFIDAAADEDFVASLPSNGINVIRNGTILTLAPGDLQVGDIACRVSVNPYVAPGTEVGTPQAPQSAAACTPLNLFGEGVALPGAIDFVTAETLAESRNTQHVFNVNFGGGLFDLFDNEVGFNVGYERRTERQEFTPDGFLQEGLGRSVPIAAVEGSFTTNEFFGELLVPLIQPHNDSFIHRLELDGSARYIDNSQAGSDWIWSVGAQLAPIEDITLRGSYTRSVRAPAITELFLPAVQIFSFADDPCDVDFREAGPDPALRQANCAADGLAADFDSQIDDASQPITSSGNPNLLNEKSKAWTVGAIVQPRFIRGLTLTADWVDISVTDAITTLDLTDVLRSCYDNPDFPNVATCDQFQRDANGQIVGAQVGQSNAGLFEFAGLQASARYGFALGNGDLDLIGRYFYVDKNEFTVVGVLDDNRGEIGDFTHSISGTVRYSHGPATVALTGNYLSGAAFDLQEDQTADYARVGDYIVFDLSAGVDVTDRINVQATVNNLFNEKAPFPSRSPVFYTDGMLGRQFLLRVGTSF